MQRRSWKHLVLLPVVLLSFSCERIPEKETHDDVAVEWLEDDDAIPMEFGQLVAVSTRPNQITTRLWYVDEEGTVRIVGYGNRTSRLELRVRVLRRN